MLKFLKLAFFSLVAICVTENVAAQSTVIFEDENQGVYIGRNVDIHRDSTKSLSFEAVRNSPELFRRSKTDVPNFGVTRFNSWIRFRLTNNSADSTVILNLENPTIDQVTLYFIYPDKRIDSMSISGSQPVRTRIYDSQYFIFDIPANPGESFICYIKLKGSKQILAPLTLQNHKNLLSSISKADLFAGIYFGIMLVMLLYNLFIYTSVRDRSYLVYVNYIFWVTLTQATLLGYSHRFLWTDNVWLANNMVTICGVLIGLATISFTRSFLRTKTYLPGIHPLLNILNLGYIVALLLLLVGFPGLAYHVVDAMAGIGAIVILVTAYRVSRKKYKAARYFLIAWTIFLVSVFLFVLKDYGVLPYNFITVHSLQLGSAIEAILLSFALADRINTLKKEKEASQEEALKAAQENERIIREQNLILETRVSERTFELNEANIELSQTLVDLKEAESQLVEAEKMASLGQLTAGIAHEINNPINFVTSNVNPLKRDIDILLDTIDTIETVALSSASPSEKQQQIDDFKEEIDFDYLKIEIGHLIKGINEGASRTAEIVKGLRIFSRLDEDDLKKANINEGLDSTIVIVNNLLTNRITLRKNYSDIPEIECYPGKLNQVFLNIISNAIHAIKKKYGDEQGGQINITTLNEEKGVVIKIADNGTGM
ncbi:MAG TPA: 7TM diverse intracellular signaling domain-containing protein, partial [Daejeonella sp.]|nr:7TM diverse intracellular signaling domain-containing protein [Daejeonella sp.]